MGRFTSIFGLFPRHFFVLGMLLWVGFSMANCGVRTQLAHAVGQEYERPLNKTKSASTCISAQAFEQEYSSKNFMHKLQVDATEIPFIHHAESLPHGELQPITARQYYSSFPARFILYKQLKISLA